jgi:hypothetical protein
VVQARSFPVIDPLERHAGDIRAQDVLRKRTDGRSRALGALVVPVMDRADFRFHLVASRSASVENPGGM